MANGHHWSSWRTSLAASCTIATSVLGACHGSQRNSAVTAQPVALDEISYPVRTIVLDETPEVINVRPHVREDPWGGIFVADPSERQIRRYSDNGTLLTYFGAEGRGPGEFEAPMVALRLPAGQILAADLNNKFVIYDSIGSQMLREVRTPFRYVAYVDAINDSLLLVGGIAGSASPASNAPRMYIWNVNSDSIITSFLSPHIDRHNQLAATAITWSIATIRNDTIAAIIPFSDTVYLFLPDGTPLNRIPLPSRSFRQIRPPPRKAAIGSRAELEWFSSFDLITAVAWGRANEIILEYKPIGYVRSNLLLTKSDGQPVAEVIDAPQLLAVSADGLTIYLNNTNSSAPNQWDVARLR